uniref:Ig-like domain-containing protein n=1 Tax=Terrapene triunguis TaxID=2587831 RepID=A0A674IFK7_9SAUR
MLWAPVIVLLGAWCTGKDTPLDPALLAQGASSQLVVTQPLSVADPLGTTVKLSCALSSGYSIGNDRVRWYQQKPGSAPRFVYHYYTSSDQGRGTGIPARFTISPDTSNNLWNLVISGVQAEDEADYYCYTWDGKQSVAAHTGQRTPLLPPRAL